ncbi:hypothetical protein LBMAG52_01440 [Planctomycetia bacterium]|nr:hypothetical protein LBMAG52_01440 [Planctomycetia bacterium]
MAKKSATNKATDKPKVNKSAAVREYLKAHKGAMPKEIVPALKAKGIDISPQMVSMIKAKQKIKQAQRRAKEAPADDATAGAKTNRAAGLDAALTLYKASQGIETPKNKIREAFLLLVEMLG